MTSSPQLIRLDNNDLYEVKREWFLGLTSLNSLYLGHNNIADLGLDLFDRLTRLQHLDLSDNALDNIPDTALKGLTHLRLLNMSGNFRLNTIPGSRANRTEDKVIDGEEVPPIVNGIPISYWSSNGTAVPNKLALMTSLRILLLDRIPVTRLSSLAVNSLTVSDLSISFLPRLRVVDKWAFFNMQKLQTLQLHDNPQLVFIHPQAFAGLPLLKRLLIHNNGLVALPASIPKSLPSLSEIQIHHNQLHCDCNIRWLWQDLGSQKYGSHSAVETKFSIKKDRNRYVNTRPMDTTISKSPNATTTNLPNTPPSQSTLSTSLEIFPSYNVTVSLPVLNVLNTTISHTLNISNDSDIHQPTSNSSLSLLLHHRHHPRSKLPPTPQHRITTT